MFIENVVPPYLLFFSGAAGDVIPAAPAIRAAEKQKEE